MEQQFEDQVVAKNGSMSWTHRELSALFTRVQNQENWKLPVNAVVEMANDRELLGTREAVIFFTGSVPQIVVDGFYPGGRYGGARVRYRVTAAGYYAAIGA